MHSELYKIVLTGIKPQNNPDTVYKNIAHLFHTTPEYARQAFSKAPVVIKKGIDHDTALKYQKAIEDAGAVCNVKPVESSAENEKPVLKTCPKCSYRAFSSDDPLITAYGGLGECPSCGFIDKKTEKNEKVPVQTKKKGEAVTAEKTGQEFKEMQTRLNEEIQDITEKTKGNWADTASGCILILWLAFLALMLILALTGALSWADAGISALVSLVFMTVSIAPISAFTSGERAEKPFPEGRDIPDDIMSIVGPVRLGMLEKVDVRGASPSGMKTSGILLVFSGTFLEMLSWALALAGSGAFLLAEKAEDRPLRKGARKLIYYKDYFRFKKAMHRRKFQWKDVVNASAGNLPGNPEAVWFFDGFDGMIYTLERIGEMFQLKIMDNPPMVYDIHPGEIKNIEIIDEKAKDFPPRLKNQPHDNYISVSVVSSGGDKIEFKALGFTRTCSTISGWKKELHKAGIW